MSEYNQKIFEETRLDTLFKDIYDNHSFQKDKIKGLMEKFMNHVNDKYDAAAMMPTFAQLMDVSIKNDEQLIKLATVVQRLITNSKTGSADNSLDWITSIVADSESALKKDNDQIDGSVGEIEKTAEKILETNPSGSDIVVNINEGMLVDNGIE